MATKDEILNLVKKHLMDNLEDLAEKDFDPTKSMKAMGANSLDIVEVVSCTMRDLKVKVPRSELSKLTTVQELVDMLYNVLQQGPQAQGAS